MKKKIAIALAGLLLILGGCSGVEPERRAFPLIISVDHQQTDYQVIYAMANMPAQTGQEKSGEEENTLVNSYQAQNMETILQLYNSSQEFYLDQGHVQIILLGNTLLKDEKHLTEILDYLEKEPSIGDNTYVFCCQDPEAVMKTNGSTVESLSDYLIGIYQNRETPREKQMIRLQDMLYAWHNAGTLPAPPEVVLKNNIPQIPALME